MKKGVQIFSFIQRGNGSGRATSIYLFSKLFSKSLAFLLIPVWTSVYVPSEYGMIGTLIAWAGVLSPLVLLGLPSALIRLRSDFESEDEWHVLVTSVSVVVVGCGILFLVAGLIFGPWVWEQIHSGGIPFWPYVPFALTGIAVSCLGRVGLAVQQANLKPGRAIFYEQLLGLGTTLLALIFVVLLSGGVIGYQIAGLLSGLICSLVFVNEVRKSKLCAIFDFSKVKIALAFGIPLIPQALAAWVLGLSDRVMVERYSGLVEAGYYNLAANFGVVISMVAISIYQAVLPRYLQRAKHSFESLPERRLALRKVVIQGFVVLVGIFVMAASAGPMVLGWMINERYVEALPLLVPLLGGCFFFGISQFLLLPLLYKKKTGLLATITTAGAILNVGLNLYFIPEYGAMAAAYTTLASYIVTCGLVYFFAHRADWFGISIVELFAICGGASACIVICLWFDGPTVADLAWRFGLNGILVVSFAVWLWNLFGAHKS
ncbi:oligosaccharide flippase family protein, partial [Akkermansiaceae bacterium]|nr:oligosaccharide flippase family protein [Akkermansiaceae bacterium]